MTDLKDRVTEAFSALEISQCECGPIMLVTGTPEQFVSASRSLLAGEALGEEECIAEGEKLYLDRRSQLAHARGMRDGQRRLLGTDGENTDE